MHIIHLLLSACIAIPIPQQLSTKAKEVITTTAIMGALYLALNYPQLKSAIVGLIGSAKKVKPGSVVEGLGDVKAMGLGKNLKPLLVVEGLGKIDANAAAKPLKPAWRNLKVPAIPAFKRVSFDKSPLQEVRKSLMPPFAFKPIDAPHASTLRRQTGTEPMGMREPLREGK